MGLSLVVFDIVAFQPVHEFLDPRTIEADMVDPSGAVAGFGLGGCAFVAGAQIFILMIGVVGLADMDHVLVADIEPMDRKSELWMVTGPESEIGDPPVARPVRVIGEDQNMLHEIQAHGSAPYVGCREITLV